MTSDVSPPTSASDSPFSLLLDESEQRVVADLANQLIDARPALIDDPSWQEQARRLSCQLPVRLREAVRRYRYDPGAAGTLVVSGLPIAEPALVATPGVRESVERVAAAPSAVAMLVGVHLGEVIAYRAEKTGALVQNLVPVQGLEASQSNAGSVPLELHIENAFHPCRPDYVGLLCLRNDHAKKAGTLVASMRHALALITPADRAVLAEPRFITAPPPSFHAGDQTHAHAILDGRPEDPNVCLDFNATSPLDDLAKHVLERLRRTLNEVAVSLVLQPGQMAFVDNRIVLHGRSEFTPRYDGRDRWLHRVYVHLDNRRTRSARRDNGAVLD